MEVTRGHQQFFANSLRSKWDRDVGLVSLRLSLQGASNDVHFDLLGSPTALALTWPEVKFCPWPFKVTLYMVRRALTKQTRWHQYRCSTFKSKYFIVQKPFWKILEFWPLVTSILTWAKKNDRNDFEIIFRELSNAVFRFVLRCAGAEIDGGVQAPPIRWWKSRGPSGSGLTLVLSWDSQFGCKT